MNKKILIITPFCAPESHAAVFRAHKLAKYLKKEGWKPQILTVDTNYNYNEDPALLNELEGISIHRTKYIEPSLRGLYMWFTGKDRTYKTLKSKAHYQNKQDLKSDECHVKKTFFRKTYNYLLENYLKKPDRFWTWKKSAIKKAKELIEKEGIQFIYTTCLPFTTNQIGIELKKTTDIKWVSDFRDPITYAKRMHSDVFHVYKLQKQIQDDTFKYADHITVLSSSYELIFNDQYEGEYNYKISFIPTGIDDSYIPSLNNKKKNEIIFVGEYLKEYEDHFFRIYKKAIQGNQDVPKIRMIGNIEINKKQVSSYIKKLNIEDNIIFEDHMPQNKLYEFINNSRYALILVGNKTHWWNNFAKLVDYIALQKHVIALVPNISEAKSELEKTKSGIFLTDNDTKNIGILKRVFDKENSEEEIDTDYCKRYLASSQTKSFVQIFNSL
ncbi:hypothetical protein [Psychroflexus tropicus]|uniref:hypothetical protein n=1 Tax=Psychroflexus tropicus TaxID=197345 RepID=UPI000371038C|nr:hypothetical protein [Psychroflexus tropicus]